MLPECFSPSSVSLGGAIFISPIGGAGQHHLSKHPEAVRSIFFLKCNEFLGHCSDIGSVTLVSCALAAVLFGTLGICVTMSGRWLTELFTNVEAVVFAGTAYFQAMGLVYGFLAVSAMLFSAYQGWGRATAPLFVSLLRFTIVLVGGWIVLQHPLARLDWLYYLVAGSVVSAALVLGFIFFFWTPNRSIGMVLSGGGRSKTD